MKCILEELMTTKNKEKKSVYITIFMVKRGSTLSKIVRHKLDMVQRCRQKICNVRNFQFELQISFSGASAVETFPIRKPSCSSPDFSCPCIAAPLPALSRGNTTPSLCTSLVRYCLLIPRASSFYYYYQSLLCR